MTREEKLDIVKNAKSIGNTSFPWKTLKPNAHGDWLSLRSDAFDTFIPLEAEKKYDVNASSFFVANSLGLLTARDSWAYNFSNKKLESNMRSMIKFYEAERERFHKLTKKKDAKDSIEYDTTKIGWTHNVINDLEKNKQHKLYEENIVKSSYRPFIKQFVYFDRNFNERVYQLPKLFPVNQETGNIVIVAMGSGASRDFSPLISSVLPNYDYVEKSQCFPLYYYEEREKLAKGLFDEEGDGDYIKRDGVSDFILERALKLYGKAVTKEDIFYYVYGFLHSADYKETFASDLKKMLPRLPLVEDVKDFWAFSKAGRALAELHLNYETVPAFAGVKITGADKKNFVVEKMRFPKKDQKDTIIYNGAITIENIPAKAYEYVVNGKSAIEWIMERYQVSSHKESGIKNDPNDWSKEVGKPSYIFDLLLSIINVSVQTVDIVNNLPKVKFE